MIPMMRVMYMPTHWLRLGVGKRGGWHGLVMRMRLYQPKRPDTRRSTIATYRLVLKTKDMGTEK